MRVIGEWAVFGKARIVARADEAEGIAGAHSQRQPFAVYERCVRQSAHGFPIQTRTIRTMRWIFGIVGLLLGGLS
ncbi:hypothetical protein, partial [Ralstonia pickettii]|uniref:hypothetical protein n=1 Tax=Ralstonia pickettii TaxID=329 RepID=UPI001BB048CE